MINHFLLVGAGGMAGSMLRYAVSLFIRNTSFPLATFAVNITGSFIIGLVLGYSQRNPGFEADWRLFLATGVCGGFTTFSAFSAEGIQLLTHQRYLVFFLYFAASMILGLLATYLGMMIAKQ
jgi:fluoride exporter